MKIYGNFFFKYEKLNFVIIFFFFLLVWCVIVSFYGRVYRGKIVWDFSPNEQKFSVDFILYCVSHFPNDFLIFLWVMRWRFEVDFVVFGNFCFWGGRKFNLGKEKRLVKITLRTELK
jgi:hypothetical protein